MKWRDVKKSLPEEMTTVLVSLSCDTVSIGFHLGDGTWEVEREKAWMDNEEVEVTHWMPLPAPASISTNGEWPYPEVLIPLRPIESN